MILKQDYINIVVTLKVFARRITKVVVVDGGGGVEMMKTGTRRNLQQECNSSVRAVWLPCTNSVTIVQKLCDRSATTVTSSAALAETVRDAPAKRR
jgi:hypothetical protein